ncbi:DeoR/GlpR family DNA-binding transcription regulator [Spelaeicoccus albus]|uniref:DeoR/GlpR family transcriptional regulator of sugar metabolism n=1 Tax=Spelaeicoccus albus TaxID=1280376 RepID=A0A7Z0A9N8_9MICO|nr:DeoR/GlpR family DNA-binding transcription regulator [Spelaeicoccus albus]NYI66166.1 DeoR/GlpR family transcriptional regulator of sugar metabolism [Spelaeicoccus albus]
MLAAERQAQIVDRIRHDGISRVRDLAALLRVSDMTVRRDIDALVEGGLLERVHGGAKVPGRLSSDEPGFEMKSTRQETEKQAIARAAIELVSPGLAIGVSAGTTTWTLARQLRDMASLTVVTNSIRVADEFYDRAGKKQSVDSSVILTGGERTPSDALVGPMAVSSLKQLHLDVLFLGVHGIDEAAGFTTPNLMESETNRAFAAAAHTVVVLADHTKWGTVGMSSIAALDDVDILITDSQLPTDALDLLRSRIPDVRIAG